MQGMKFAALSLAGRTGIAVSVDDRFNGYFSDEPEYPGSLDDVIQRGADLRAVAAALAAGPVIDMTAARFLPPLSRPSKILCIGLNYAEHTAEVGFTQPAVPEVFPRFASSLIGHDAPVRRPPESQALDYEAELVVVIGTRGRRIAREQALAHVAAYSIFNDATLRDYQFRTAQWTIGKNFDSTGGFGPYLVTPEGLPPGCAGLRIQGRLNGRIVQEASTDQLIYDIPALIALLSETMTLEAGDVILTGTPSGIGWSRDPRLMMQPGDAFEAEVEGIGVLRNPVIDEQP